MIELQRCETADLIQEATDAISNIRISIDNEIGVQIWVRYMMPHVKNDGNIFVADAKWVPDATFKKF